MKKFITNKYTLYSFGLIIFFLLWIIISLGINEPVMIFPNPWDTFAYVGNIFTTTYFWNSLGYSVLRMIIGFSIALVLALILGSIAGKNSKIYFLLKPTITVLKSVPTAALVFLFLVLVKADQVPILIVILLSFPILYESISHGIHHVDETLIEAAKVDGSGYLNLLFHVQLPLSMPYFLVGVASSFALSFKIEIMAEIITGDNGYGLGCAIKYFRSSDPSNMIPVFGYCLVAILLVLAIDFFGLKAKKYNKSKIKPHTSNT